MLKKIPNILTIGRIIIVPFFVLAFYLPGFYGDLTALILFIVASFTDFLDGMLARMFGLAKLKTVLQMVSIALLLSGDTRNKIINFQDYNAQTIGIILLWLSAALTLFTAYDYMRKGIDHAMSEDSKD